MRFIFFGLVLLQIGFIACDWNQWANGNNGVHDRPVYTSQPNIKWSFNPPVPSVIKGVINIDDATGNIIVPNSASSQPLFWVLDKHGNIVYSFNDTEAGSCSGALTVENGIVYVLNEVTCKVSAVSIINETLLWVSDELCLFPPNDGPVAGPITIVQGYLVMVPLRAGFMCLYKDSGAWAPFDRINEEYSAQFFTPTYSPFDATTVLYWPSSQLTKASSGLGWSVKVSSDPNYNDPNMYPMLMDLTNGEIYVTLSVGSVFKYSPTGQYIWNVSFPLQSDHTSIQHGLVLIDRSYLIVNANDTFYAINATTGEYNAVVIDKVTIGQVKAQLLYSNNVLYATDGLGNLAAYDVTDRLNWKNLWTMNAAGTNFTVTGAGPSIGSDGTIYVGSASGDADTPTLITLGCPEAQYLDENGVCVSCSGGIYLNETAVCVLCGDGLVPDANRTACEECSDGTFSMSGDDTCTPCSEQPDNAQCPPPPVTPPVAVPSTEVSEATQLRSLKAFICMFFAVILSC